MRAIPFRQALIAWALLAAATLWLSGVSLDTDSAMRLAEVRDLLHGQAWLDTAQHRMNIPYGLPMHWSRLVDAPLALLIALAGEHAALIAWPLLMALAVMAALARLAFDAGGKLAAGLVLLLTLLAVMLLGLFAPGSIDHHNVQAALMLWTLVGLVERRPVLAAAGVALGLGVGLEVLPYALVAILAAALWLRDDPRLARHFGLALALLGLLLLLATTAARYRALPACDTYSLFYAMLLLAGGTGLAALSLFSRHVLVSFAVLAAALLLLAALLNPDCLAGPYGGMDPRLRDIFLSRINEARSAFAFFSFAPSEWVAGFFYAAVLFTGSLFAPHSGGRRVRIAFAAMALAVAAWQVRAVPFAILFALPGFAAALVRLFRARGIVALAAALLLGNQAGFAVAGVALEGVGRHTARIRAFGAQEGCAAPQVMELLKAQPRGRVAAFVDQGPAILAYTPDSVIAGPYHRDAQGILDTYAIFTAPDGRARLKARGIRYLMVCRAAPDWDYYRARGGLVAALAAGRAPAWLVPLGARGDVALYRVLY